MWLSSRRRRVFFSCSLMCFCCGSQIRVWWERHQHWWCRTQAFSKLLWNDVIPSFDGYTYSKFKKKS
jgi:hypothetical protein